MGPNLYVPPAWDSGFFFEAGLHVLWMSVEGTLDPLIKISGCQSFCLAAESQIGSYP